MEKADEEKEQKKINRKKEKEAKKKQKEIEKAEKAANKGSGDEDEEEDEEETPEQEAGRQHFDAHGKAGEARAALSAHRSSGAAPRPELHTPPNPTPKRNFAPL